MSGLLACCSAIMAAPLNVVTVNWEPFFGPSLKDNGVVSEIVSSAFLQKNREIDISFIPWSRALKTVKMKNNDVIMGLWYSEERGKDLLFSQPFMSNRVVFIKRKGDDFEYTDRYSLKGKQIGVLMDYAYEDDFNQSTLFDRFQVRTLNINLKKLVAGRIELTLEDEIVAKDVLNKELPELKGKIAFTQNALVEKPLHIAVSRSHPQAKQIVADFNAGLEEIKKSGLYQQILKKHGFD